MRRVLDEAPRTAAAKDEQMRRIGALLDKARSVQRRAHATDDPRTVTEGSRARPGTTPHRGVWNRAHARARGRTEPHRNDPAG